MQNTAAEKPIVGKSTSSSPLWVSAEVVLFTISDRRLRLLLVQSPDWSLPGQRLISGEDPDTCAKRALVEQSGYSGLYLEQLYTFGESIRGDADGDIVVAYCALVPMGHRYEDPPAGQTGWFAVDELPALAARQHKTFGLAYRRLKSKLAYSTIVFQLMPDKFTLSDLQAVNEVILGEALDKRNFRKRTLALDHIEQTDEVRRNGSHRPARLYRVREPNKVHFIK